MANTKNHIYEHISDLVSKAQDGDALAVGELYEFYQPLIRGAIKRLTRKYSQLVPHIDDLHSDAYLIIRNLIFAYNPTLSVFSYYLSLRMDHALLSHARRTYLDVSVGGRSAIQTDLDGVPFDWEPASQSDPFAELLDRDELNVALETLDVGDREVIEMYFFKGYTQETAAVKCNITQSAFSKRLNKALLRLKMILERHREFETVTVEK